MKKIYALLLAVLGTATLNAQNDTLRGRVLNWDFEEAVDAPGGDFTPADWFVLSDSAVVFGPVWQGNAGLIFNYSDMGATNGGAIAQNIVPAAGEIMDSITFLAAFDYDDQVAGVDSVYMGVLIYNGQDYVSSLGYTIPLNFGGLQLLTPYSWTLDMTQVTDPWTDVILVLSSYNIEAQNPTSSIAVDNVVAWGRASTASVTSTEVSTSVYPNPATEMINFEISDYTNVASIEIFNLSGQKVSSVDVNGAATQTSVANMDAGIYIYSVIGTNGEVLSTNKFSVAK